MKPQAKILQLPWVINVESLHRVTVCVRTCVMCNQTKCCFGDTVH